MLTKDDMLVALHDAITEDQEFELADEIVDAMEAYPQPFDLVDPVLDFISKHPEVDFELQVSWFTLWSDFIIRAMRNFDGVSSKKSNCA